MQIAKSREFNSIKENLTEKKDEIEKCKNIISQLQAKIVSLEEKLR